MTAGVVSRSGSSFLVEGEPRYLFRYVAEEPEEGGESEEKLALVRYLGEEENVTVPGYIEHLYDEAFRYTNVVEVNIPDGMTMGNIVFDHCENLERVNLPSDLTTIPIHTFNSCKNLTEISLPTGVTEIGSSAFSGCENLREIILPEGVWLIDDHAFSDCTMLESISLPDTLEALGYSVFYHCDSLKEIHLPDTLMYWYAGAGYPYDSFDIFDECYAKLFCHTQNSSAAALISEDGHCFYLEDDPSLGYRYEIVFEGDHNRYDLWLAEYEKNTKAVVEIPPFVDKIASYLFSEDETIKRVEIPEGVTSIGENFYGCPALSEVVVPSSVEEIIWPSFYGSPNLLMVVQEGSYAERYAIEHEFPYTHSFTISTELKVTLDTDEIESYEGMLLSVKIGETKISRTIKGAKDYVFKNLPKDSTCDIYITNQYGDFIAERNNILLADETTSVTIDNLKRMSAVSATVTDGAADYTEQVTVTWMDEQESVLSVGKILYNVPFGKTILCKVTLPNALAPKYQVPAVASCEADKESVEINISLQPLPKLTVNGIVKCAGDAPAKASVSVAQTINGKYTHNQTVVVGTDGTFSLELLPGKAEFEVSCQEYQTVQFEKVLDGDTDLGEISLMPLVGYKIGVNASYQKAVVASETAQAETLTNLSDLSFIIYNKTGKHEISDFTVQNTDITLLEEAAEGDELEIRVSSRSSVFDDCKGTIQVSSEKAVLNLTIMEHGRLRVTLPSENAGANKLLLYRADGELAWTAETTRVNVDSPSLSAGNYTLIAMQSTEYVETPASLSVLNEMGLKENTDYVKENVEIRNGWIQVTALSSIPAFDAARYYYTDTAATGFYLNKNQVTKGRYLTLYAYAPLQEKYVSRATDFVWSLEIPEGLAFADGTLNVGGSGNVPYEKQDRRLLIPVTDPSQRIRLCLVGAEEGDWTISGSLKFLIDGKTMVQPVGTVSARVGAYDFTFDLPEKTYETSINLSGFAPDHAKIDFYDNDVLTARTTAFESGKWTCTIPLNITDEIQRVGGEFHAIYAVITPIYGSSFQSEEKYVWYQYIENPPKVKRILMKSYNHMTGHTTYEMEDETAQVGLPSGDEDQDTIEVVLYDAEAGIGYLDGQTIDISGILETISWNMEENVDDEDSFLSAVGAQVYIFDPSYPTFEFLVMFDGDADSVTDVAVSVGCSDSSVQVIRANKDENNQAWVAASDDFNSFRKPNTIRISFDINDDFRAEETDIDALASKLQEKLEGISSIDDLEEILAEIEELFAAIQESPDLDQVSSDEIAAIQKDVYTLKANYVNYKEASSEFSNHFNDVQIDERNFAYTVDAGFSYQASVLDELPTVQSLETQGYEKIESPSGQNLYGKIDYAGEWESLVNNGHQGEIPGENAPSITSKLVDLENGIYIQERMTAPANTYDGILDSIGNTVDKAGKISDGTDALIFSMQQAAKNPKIPHAEKIGKVADRMEVLKSNIDDFQVIKENTKIGPIKAGKMTAGNLLGIVGGFFTDKEIYDMAKMEVQLQDLMMQYNESTPEYAELKKAKDRIGRHKWLTSAENTLGMGLIYGALNIPLPQGRAACGIGAAALGLESAYLHGHFADKAKDEAKALLKKYRDKYPYQYDGLEPFSGIEDPSGFVYEAVASNRVEGATLTLHEKVISEDIYGGSVEKISFWDAKPYDQQNPLISDHLGQYMWDVPDGYWQVKSEKKGYVTAYSDWLEVPPPQFDVNLAMVSYEAPDVKSVNAYTDAVDIEISKYVKPATLTRNSVKVFADGKQISGSIEFCNLEENPQKPEESFVSILKFVPESALQKGEALTVKLGTEIESYAGVPAASGIVREATVKVRPNSFTATENLQLTKGQVGTIELQVLPKDAAAGEEVMIDDGGTYILSSVAKSVVLDENSHALVEVTANLPGVSNINFSFDDGNFNAVTKVTVSKVKNLEELKPELSQNSYTYDGKEKKPEVKLDGLEEGRDFTVAYENNINAGTAYAVITGMGNYAGTLRQSFTILKAKNKITASNKEVFANASRKQTIAIGAKALGGKLTYASNNKKVTVNAKGKATIPAKFKGTVKITITAGNNNYKKVTKTIQIKVKPIPLAKPAAPAVTPLAGGIKLTWKKTANAASYAIYRKAGNKTAKIATVKTLTYTDKKAANGTSYTYYVQAVGSGIYATGSKSAGTVMTFMTVPAKLTIKSTAAKTAAVSWQKNAKATGYQVRYSTNANMKNAVTVVVKKPNTVKTTIKNLKSKTVCYFQIRAYKTVGKKTYYSAWSSNAKVNVK